VIAIMICDDCDEQMQEVFTASENFKTQGLECVSPVYTSSPAIGRERGYTKNDFEEKDKNDSRAC